MRRDHVSKNKMTSALLILFLLPSLLMVSLSLSSLAIGIVISSCIIIFFHLIKQKKFKISKIYIFACGISALWVFAHPISVENSVHAKQVLSLAAIIICGFAITSLFNLRLDGLDKKIGIVFWILSGIGLLGVFDLFRPGDYQLLNRPILPFSEPSHFAIAFTPIACSYAMLSSNGVRLLVCLLSFALAISLPNLTLLVGTFLVSMVALRNRAVIVFMVMMCIATIVIIFSNFDGVDYFVNRLATSEEDNLSRLVYIQGWESVTSALKFSNGFGVGFQNLGIEPPSQTSLLVESITGVQLNRADGSFLAAKLIGEFGVIGVAIVFYATTLSVQAGIFLRKHIYKRVAQSSDIITLCFAYTLLLELFIRSTGYFSSTLVIALYLAPKAVKVIKRAVYSRRINSSNSIEI